MGRGIAGRQDPLQNGEDHMKHDRSTGAESPDPPEPLPHNAAPDPRYSSMRRRRWPACCAARVSVSGTRVRR
jgi:hypothetical protein